MKSLTFTLALTLGVILLAGGCGKKKSDPPIDWTKYQIERVSPSGPGPVGNPGTVSLQGPDVTEGGGVHHYEWTFGDGQAQDGSQVPGHGLNVSHPYGASNDYTVQVVVVLNDGRRSTPLSLTIRVDLEGPQIAIASLTLAGQLNEPAAVSVNGVTDQDGSDANQSWSTTVDLGTHDLPVDPGFSSTTATPMELTVEARDPSGNVSSQAMTVVVNPLE